MTEYFPSLFSSFEELYDHRRNYSYFILEHFHGHRLNFISITKNIRASIWMTFEAGRSECRVHSSAPADWGRPSGDDSALLGVRWCPTLDPPNENCWSVEVLLIYGYLFLNFSALLSAIFNKSLRHQSTSDHLKSRSITTE